MHGIAGGGERDGGWGYRVKSEELFGAGAGCANSKRVGKRTGLHRGAGKGTGAVQEGWGCRRSVFILVNAPPLFAG